jgi:hypothetical protein
MVLFPMEQHASVTATPGGVVSTLSCTCCRVDAVAVCVSDVVTTPRAGCASTAARDTIGIRPDPWTIARRA